MGKRLLESYQWWRFEPHPEWVEPHWGEGDFYEPYATGVPRGVRIIACLGTERPYGIGSKLRE